MSDAVNHPKYYQNRVKCSCGRQVECIEVAETFDLLIGSAIQYLWRFESKGRPVQDLRKAVFYVTRKLGKLTNQDIEAVFTCKRCGNVMDPENHACSP